ncbi:MAG: HAMP domain-containing sensor histidine kinase [Propionibacteriaceae bacterium]
MTRDPGISVRLKLTLSYAGFLMLAGALLLAAVWVFLLRGGRNDLFIPGLADFLRALDPHNFGPRVFLPAAVLVLGFLLLFGLVGGWILAGRMLAPLTRLTAVTRATSTGSLSHRIELAGRQDEFRELADAFDAMLARLEEQVSEQQRFAANASHELRTPLATAQTILDVASTDPHQDPAELIARLKAVNARAIHLTDALLLLSTADQLATTELVDLSLLADEATETLLPLAEQRGVDLRTSGDLAPTVGSPTLLLQLVTNLVQNAIVHNLSDQGHVWVTTSRQPAGSVLTVENTGVTIPPHVVSTLTEPFQRGDNRVHRDHTGAGLGLAIAQRITLAHHGTLRLTARPAGGLLVRVRLPPPTPEIAEPRSGEASRAWS